MKISNKQDMYALYYAGKFGNKLRTWPTLNEFIQSAYEGSVSIRYSGAQGGKWHAYNVPYPAVFGIVDGWVREGADIQKITFNEVPPDDQLLIQGDVQESARGLELRYSTSPGKSHRQGLADPSHACGLRAKIILEHFLHPNSLDDLHILFETYPEHVVEFSSYEVKVGDRPRRNSIFWEVRAY